MATSMAERTTDKNTVQSESDDEIFLPTVNEKRPGHLALQRQLNVMRDSFSSDDDDSNHVGGFAFGLQYGARLGKEALDRQSSIVDGLLCEIYDRYHGSQRDSFDSDTFTECSSTSEIFHPRGSTYALDLERRHARQLHRAFLETKGVEELRSMVKELEYSSAQISARLIRQLKRKDRRAAKLQKNCDIVTAVIQASSLKRRIDTRMKFSLEPPLGASAFEQWKDAMRAVARLPLGIPDDFRKKVWLSLADEHIRDLKVDWEKTVRFAFNEKSNPDDNKLGLQIVKDLHRTGCTGFNGQDNEQDRAVLKRVLLAYARWNKHVGYCQGFNVIAALLLDVMGRKEDDAVKVMIYLIDHVLPDSYFANNLRALSVDMAVFRDLLRWKYPKLSKHLDYLQHTSGEKCAGPNYEPPLTNVFTMQWFLTLFATCLPKHIVLRVWDSILLEGSEILLRTALVIWGKLAGHILSVESADEFYTVMGFLCQDLMDGKMVDADDLIKTVYTMAPFPFPQLVELREKYTYNITPFSAAVNAKNKPARHMTMGIFSDDDDWDDEDIEAITCFTGIFHMQGVQAKLKGNDMDPSLQPTSISGDISSLGPGAYGAAADQLPKVPAYMERMTTDISALKKQYKKLRQRQTQAHIILSAVTKRQKTPMVKPRPAPMVPKIESPLAMNHLFIVQQSSGQRNRCVTDGPRIAPIYPKIRGPAIHVSQAHGKLSRKDSNMSTRSCRSTDAIGLDYNTISGMGPVSRDRAGSMVSIGSEYSATSVVPSEDSRDAPLSPTSDKQSSTDSGESAIMRECLDIEERKILDMAEDIETTNSDQDVKDLAEDMSRDFQNDAEDKENLEVSTCIENLESKAAVIEQTSIDEIITKSKSDSHDGDVVVNAHVNKAKVRSKPVRYHSSDSNSSEELQHKEDNSQQKLAEDTAMYVYQVHKRKQANQSAWSSSSSSSQPASPTSPNWTIPSGPLTKTGKPFNPFPVRHMNQHRVQTGVKLGLYTQETLEELETKVSGIKKQLHSSAHGKSRTSIFGLR